MTFDSMVRQLPGLWQDARTRRQILGSMGVLAGVGAGLAGYAFFEPLHVRLDYLTVRLPNAQGHLPPAGLRILHLSDTHFCGKQWREQPKIDSVRRACAGLDYDLLIHTGDFLHEDEGLPNLLALLDTLPKPKLGAYAVFGNHDYTLYSHADMLPRAWAKFCELRRANQQATGRRTLWNAARALVQFGHYFANSPLDLKRTGTNNVMALEAALVERNIHILHNRCVRLTHCPDQSQGGQAQGGQAHGIDIYIAGVDDVVEGTPNMHSALDEIPYDAPTILLSHNPDILQDPGIAQADLVLSGHTHGGQVVLPLLGAAHTQTKHLSRREVSGYLRRGKTQVYITRGIGEGIPLRLGAAPQVTLITVQAE